MKGQYVIINLLDMDFMKNKEGKINYYDTEEEAFSHEVLLISCFRGMGYELANLTDGGDGTSGYKQTEEHKEKLRKVLY